MSEPEPLGSDGEVGPAAEATSTGEEDAVDLGVEGRKHTMR